MYKPSGIPAGSLNRTIQILEQSTTQDAYGQPQQVWTTAYTCRAAIDVQKSQLIYSTAEFLSKVTYRITVRWTATFQFAPNQRVVYVDAATNTTHTYEIQAVLNDGMANRQITLMAYENDGTA